MSVSSTGTGIMYRAALNVTPPQTCNFTHAEGPLARSILCNLVYGLFQTLQAQKWHIRGSGRSSAVYAQPCHAPPGLAVLACRQDDVVGLVAEPRRFREQCGAPPTPDLLWVCINGARKQERANRCSQSLSPEQANILKSQNI